MHLVCELLGVMHTVANPGFVWFLCSHLDGGIVGTSEAGGQLASTNSICTLICNFYQFLRDLIKCLWA